jgi:hypothetical protein
MLDSIALLFVMLVLLLLVLLLVWRAKQRRMAARKSFYLHGSDGFWEVLRTALVSRKGIQFLPSKSMPLRAEDILNQINFIWMQNAKGFPWDLHQQHSHLIFVNHIRGQICLVDKAALAEHLYQKGSPHLHPTTKVAQANESNQLRLCEGKTAALRLPGTVIIKPSNLSNGDGIQLFNATSLHALTTKLSEMDTTVVCHSKGGKATQKKRRPTKFVVQEYIDRPLLLHRKKFDIRAYVLILSPTVAFFHGGYARLCSDDYTAPAKESAHHLQVGGARLGAHVTNYTLQRQHGSKGGDDGCRWSYKQLAEWLNRHSSLDVDILDQAMHEATRDALRSVRPALGRGWAPGQFSLLGIDFLIDVDGRVWLLEFSFGPGLPVPLSGPNTGGTATTGPRWMGELHTALLASTVAVLAAARARWERCGELAPPLCQLKKIPGQGKFVRLM